MKQTSNRLTEYWTNYPECDPDENSSGWRREEHSSIWLKEGGPTATIPNVTAPLSVLNEIGTIQAKRFQSAVKSLIEELKRSGTPESGSPITSIIVPITTFAPEPFQVVSSIQVVVQGTDGDYTATFFDANVGASGETQQEAVDNLKELLIMSYESLAEDTEESLGPQMKKQKAVLDAFIKRA